MPPVIWRFSDGKSGHDSQSRGLLDALARRLPLRCFDLGAAAGWRAGAWWLARRFPPGERLPPPALLVGAGHATHLPMLAARRRYGGRSVVLMKPSLPCAWFDLCLVPQHDTGAPGANVLVTQGVLNGVRASDRHDPDTGLVVLGGPSRHVRWSDDAIVGQVHDLLRQRPRGLWRLSASRRTPATLVERLRREMPWLEVSTHTQTPPGWLAARLAEAGEVWVSRDSVSMIYEALSSGAHVGLLDVPVQPGSRVARGVDRLIARGWVSAPGQVAPAQGPARPLDEASRCADWIVQRWLSGN